MLKCRDIAADASHFVDGNASFFEKLKFHVHLALCERCRRFVRHLSITRITVARIASRKLPLADEDAGLILDDIDRRRQPDPPNSGL